jgi:hypothetical protein
MKKKMGAEGRLHAFSDTCTRRQVSQVQVYALSRGCKQGNSFMHKHVNIKMFSESHLLAKILERNLFKKRHLSEEAFHQKLSVM